MNVIYGQWKTSSCLAVELKLMLDLALTIVHLTGYVQILESHGI